MREMSDTLSEVMTKKKIITATLSILPNELNTINFNDIIDYVRNEYNADDFDIGQIIQDISRSDAPQNAKNNTTTCSSNAECMYFPNSNVKKKSKIFGTLIKYFLWKFLVHF